MGPLVGRSPARAPRRKSAFVILFLFPSCFCGKEEEEEEVACVVFFRASCFAECFRAVAARAARRFLEGPLGFLTEGIVGIFGGGGVFFFSFFFLSSW